MIINSLKIENLRNLADVDIEPHPSLNYLYGSNGAGKTSVLEALVVLSRGRSFRTSTASELVGPVDRTFRVFSTASDDEGKAYRLGLERSGKHWRGRINGRDLSQLSELTRHLPLVLMEPDSHLLVSGPPEVRRKYLDWGMFHVEQGFLDTWRKYAKALKQRNAALRTGQESVLDSLDEVLALHGSELGRYRKLHVNSVSVSICKTMERLSSSIDEIQLSYLEGWGAESYLETLKEQRNRDTERGVTTSGPHRADLVFKQGKLQARAVLSRGEQKTFAAALVLTQAEILSASGHTPVVLMDDLISEFDSEHFDGVLAHALSTSNQVWLTGTEKPALKHPGKVFHVEQGRVREMV